MVAKDFEIDDLVWAKMKGFPPWPARIAEPKDPKSPSAKKAQHFVFFFGTHDNAWILDENITPHSEEMLRNSENYKKIPAALQKAIKEIEEESRNEDKAPADDEPQEEEDEVEKPPPKTPKRTHSKTPRKSAKKRKVSEAAADPDESPAESSLFDELRTKKSPAKLPPPVEEEDDSDDDEEAEGNKRGIDPAYSQFLDNMTSSTSSKVAIIPPFNDELSRDPQQKTIIDRSVIPRPPTPPLDVETPSPNLTKKNIIPTTKKIGFLGLGKMGRGMVKNLLNSNHNVTIWNRSKKRCDDFVRAGANMAETPCDVVAACDIIMCCVSDPLVAKSLVFGNCGVLKGLGEATPGKGYVEMTSIDPETSIEIAEAVSDKGGRYLEAPVVGCRKLAEEGSLMVLGAGDQSLFKECESCFFAISNNAYFLACDVGYGAKMNLIQSMLMGNVYASLAEAMALVESCKLSTSNFLQVLNLGPLRCPLVIDKGHCMFHNEYEPDTPLKHQQKDLALALMLGHAQQQPLSMAAAANEIFKRARLLRYSEHDVAAVSLGAKV